MTNHLKYISTPDVISVCDLIDPQLTGLFKSRLKATPTWFASLDCRYRTKLPYQSESQQMDVIVTWESDTRECV